MMKKDDPETSEEMQSLHEVWFGTRKQVRVPVSHTRPIEKKVHVNLRWDDAKSLAKLLNDLLEDGSVTLHSPGYGYVGERVSLIERVIMEISCAHPVTPDAAKKTSKKR